VVCQALLLHPKIEDTEENCNILGVRQLCSFGVATGSPEEHKFGQQPVQQKHLNRVLGNGPIGKYLLDGADFIFVITDKGRSEGLKLDI